MLIRRDAWRFGAVVGVVSGAVMAFLAATPNNSLLFFSDAKFFRIVGEHPFGHAHYFIVHAAKTGDAYRYGRILYPLTAWLVALGHAHWVRWTLPIVDIISLGLAATFAAELLARRGVDEIRAAVMLIVPGVWVAMLIAFSEMFVLALILLLYLLWIDGRIVAALVVATLGLLARETFAIALLPIAWVVLRRRSFGVLAGLAASAVPLVAWWAWVHHRIGEWPPIDSSLSRREATSYPFGGMITVVQRGQAATGHWLLFAIGVVTFAAAVYVCVRRPWFPISPAALCFGILVLCLGPNAYKYPGEAIRLMTPAQALIVLSFAASQQRS